MKDVFTGEINGYTIRDFHCMLDPTITCFKTRKEIVESILSTGFFEIYFDKYYNFEPTGDDPLSDENNVCGLLNRMADYLLE